VTDNKQVLGGQGDGEWRAQAACRSVDPDLFFPLGRTGAVLDHIEAARAVCHDCTVRVDCLEFALATHQDDGIWGGTTEEERRRLRTTRPAGESGSASSPGGTTGGAAQRGVIGTRR
jgi:WhiB family redox-sensing transcriptional regulator